MSDEAMPMQVRSLTGFGLKVTPAEKRKPVSPPEIQVKKQETQLDLAPWNEEAMEMEIEPERDDSQEVNQQQVIDVVLNRSHRF